MKKKLVYICSPLRGNYEKNTQNARDFCAWVMLNYPDKVPIAPHIYFTQFLNDTNPNERSLGLEAGLAILEKCDEVMVFGDYISEGMAAELERASELGIPVSGGCIP